MYKLNLDSDILSQILGLFHFVKKQKKKEKKKETECSILDFFLAKNYSKIHLEASRISCLRRVYSF